ncbi:MAG: hypothetical protein U9Q76_09070 [candidate division WOR-3 bacterium]|nr:hypothetical protein [candidate division WOR-3 bacterium]
MFSDASRWNIPEEDIERKLKIQRELFLGAVYAVGDVALGYRTYCPFELKNHVLARCRIGQNGQEE